MIVCIATLQSFHSIERVEAFVFVTPPSTSTTTKFNDNYNCEQRHRHNGREPSIPSFDTSLCARRKDEPWSLTSGSTQKQLSQAENASQTRKQYPLTADVSYQLLDHDLLTKDQEYELGMKIRKFIDTKKQIDEIMNRKKVEQDLRRRENEKRREKEVASRRSRRQKASRMAADTSYEEMRYDDEGDDLSMEEELEELLMSKGLNNKSGRKSNSISGYRNSIEELYGSFNDEDDEEAMLDELGMAVYGIDNYSDNEGFSDDLAVVDDSFDYADGSENDVFSTLPKISDSSQLGDTLDDIRMLTEREIEDELGVEGGRKELAQILIQGALAKQQMIKSNVRLVTHIARKWMGSSKGSGNAERNSDNEKKLSKSVALGDWSTPAMDEVIQQGIVGLAIAAERFEPERKFKFSTYATYYITNEVRNIFQAATTQCLYVPPYFYTIKNKYQKIVRDHYRKTAGDPNLALSMDDIAQELQLKRERLQFILKSTQSLVQLDAPISGGMMAAGKAGGNDNSQSNDPIVNSIATDEMSPQAVVEQSLLRQCLENALAAELLPLERDIVRLRHGLDDGKSRTVKEVMESCGGMLSIGDIRTVENRAYKKLRFKHSVHNSRLRDFAEEFMGVAPEMLETVH